MEGDYVNEPSLPVIDLSQVPSERTVWGRPRWVVYLWGVCELLFVTNPWQISSGCRVRILRAFGANIGKGVIFRPSTRVRFPWKLHIGDDCWIGEGVWFHNQDHIYVGSNVVISQETMLTSGSHRHRTDMSLVTSPIYIDNGAWITSRCMVLGGTRIGRSALVKAMNRVDSDVPENAIWDLNAVVGNRFAPEGSSQ